MTILNGDPVHIVDDDGETRMLVRDLLESVGYACRDYSSAADYLAQNSRPTGVLILDLRMPGDSGLMLQRHLASSGYPVVLIFLSGHADVPASVDAMKAGAIDFLVKPFREQALLDAVTRATKHAATLLSEFEAGKRARGDYAGLTVAERDIVPLVVSGLMNKQIAARTGRSENTVKIHRSRLMQKTASRTILDLARFMDRVLKHGKSET